MINYKDDRPYPLTVTGIKHFGQEEWLEKFTPILPGSVYQEIYTRLASLYADLACEYEAKNPILHHALLAYYKTPATLANGCYYHLCFKKLQEHGIRRIFIREEMDVEQALAFIRRPDFLLDNIPHPIPLHRSVLERLRSVKINIRHHNLIQSLFSPLQKHCVMTDLENHAIQEYMTQNGISPISIRVAQFLPSRKNAEKRDKAVDDMVSSFFNATTSQLPETEDFLDCDMEALFSNAFQLIAATLSHFMRIIPENPPNPLFLESLHAPDARLFASAWKLKGGKITGFTHGNAFLYSTYKAGNSNNGAFSLCDKLIFSSSGEKLISRHDTHSPSFFSYKGEAETMMSSYNRDFIRNAGNTAKTPSAIRNIMVIGCASSWRQVPGLTDQDSISCIHLAIRMMKTLKKAEYHVIYKDHPDTLWETKGFYDDIADEIITDDFQQTYEKADCFLFPNIYSTTFGFAVMTKIPIVYAYKKEESDYWEPSIKKALDKRAVELPLTSDNNGILLFDEKLLLEAVERSPRFLDDTIVEKYAY